MLAVGGADEEVVRRAELRQQRLEALGVLIGQLLRLDAERVRRVGDRLAVLVGARQEEHILAALAVVTRHRVGGDRRVGMPKVWGRVDVVDRGSHVKGHAPSRLLSRAALPTHRAARQLPVKLVRADPRQLRHDRRGRPRAGTGIHQLAHGLDGLRVAWWRERAGSDPA